MPAQTLRNRRYTHWLLTLSSMASPRFLWKATASTPASFASAQVGETRVTAIGRDLSRHRAVVDPMAFEHRYEAPAVDRVTRFAHHIDDEPATPGHQVELVPVLHLSPTLDDAGVRLEQAHDFLARRHGFTLGNPALGLRYHLQTTARWRFRSRARWFFIRFNMLPFLDGH